MDKTLPSSLYVHIPFCESICGYCDFRKLYYRPDWADSYLLALFSEISRLHLAPKSLQTKPKHCSLFYPLTLKKGANLVVRQIPNPAKKKKSPFGKNME